MYDDDCSHCMPSMDLYIDDVRTSRVISHYERVQLNAWLFQELPVPVLLDGERYERSTDGTVTIFTSE